MVFYGQTTKAKEETIIGEEKEQVEIAYVSAAINKLGDDVTATDLQNELDKVASTEVTYNGDDTLNVFFNDTQHNYNVDNGKVDKIEHLTNPYEDENWIMSWTCSDGIWSDTIQAGNVAEGEIVAKLYETGNKIKPDGFTWIDTGKTFTFNEGNEYKLVIEGNGEMPPLFEANGTNITATYGWQLSTGMFMMGMSDTCIIPYVSEIIICDGITSIGDYAFAGASSLTKITMTNDITEIGSCAFLYNISLSNIKLSNKLTSINDSSFGSSNLESITIPRNVTNIDSGPFIECQKLSNITFLIEDTNNLNISRGIFHYLPNITIYVKNEQVKKFIEENCNMPDGAIIKIL